MAKRTPGLEKVVSIIPKAIHELGSKQEREYYQHWVLWHWADIVGEVYARNVKALRIRRQTLYVYCRDSVWGSETRFRMPQLIQQVNNYAGTKMIKDIKLSQPWDEQDEEGDVKAPEDEKKAAPPEKPEIHVGRERAKMPLTPAELSAAKKLSRGIEDEDLALKIRELYRKNRQMNKLKAAKGWHPCAVCGSLCPPETEICHRCESQRQEKIREQIRTVLRDIPWARYKEVKEYVPECTPRLLNEQRAALVQLQASKVAVNDRQSMEAKTLVMLYRCLPPEHLTEDAINRALYELRFNMYWPPDFKTPKRYEVIPLRHAKKRQYGKKNQENQQDDSQGG